MGGVGSGHKPGGFPNVDLKRHPYHNTKIPAELSQAQIDKLLRTYGVQRVAWARDGDQIMLTFIRELEIDGRHHQLGYKFQPPLFTEKRKTWNKETGRHDTEELPNLAAGMRLLYDYLKNKLAAVYWGIAPFEEEFLSEMITPEGDTFAHMVKKRGLLMLPDNPEITTVPQDAEVVRTE